MPYRVSPKAKQEDQNLVGFGRLLLDRYSTPDPRSAMEGFQKEFFPIAGPQRVVQAEYPVTGPWGGTTAQPGVIKENSIYFNLTPSSPADMRAASAGVLSHEVQHAGDIAQIQQMLHLPREDAYDLYSNLGSHSQVGDEPAGYWTQMLKAKREKFIPLPNETRGERK